MPITKSAIKTLKREHTRQAANQKIKSKFRTAFKELKANPSQEHLEAVYSAADRAAKKNVFHVNKASRIKSQAAKILKGKGTEVAKPTVKPVAESSAKSVTKAVAKTTKKSSAKPSAKATKKAKKSSKK